MTKALKDKCIEPLTILKIPPKLKQLQGDNSKIFDKIIYLKSPSKEVTLEKKSPYFPIRESPSSKKKHMGDFPFFFQDLNFNSRVVDQSREEVMKLIIFHFHASCNIYLSVHLE